MALPLLMVISLGVSKCGLKKGFEWTIFFLSDTDFADFFASACHAAVACLVLSVAVINIVFVVINIVFVLTL